MGQIQRASGRLKNPRTEKEATPDAFGSATESPALVQNGAPCSKTFGGNERGSLDSRELRGKKERGRNISFCRGRRHGWDGE